MRPVVFEIDRHDLINEEIAGCYTFGRRVLFIDVMGESFFSSCPVASIDARALSMRSLSDSPHRFAAAFGILKVQTWWLRWTRHRSSISAIARSVTSSFPAGMVASSLPFFISLRSEASVSGPFGKNFSAACFRV